MSYAHSLALQSAIYSALGTDPAVTAIVGDAIFDAMPAGEVPPIYVLLGAEEVTDASDQTGEGSWHHVALHVVTSEQGFAPAKRVAAAAYLALNNAPLALDAGHLVGLHFRKARARRHPDGVHREIVVTFRARISDSN